MCGRYTRTYTWREVRDFLDLRLPSPEEMRPSYNVAPTQVAPVCRLDASGERELVWMRWGFGSAGARPGGRTLILARAETAATSPVFRAAFLRRRCLIPASGFYEWQRTGSARQPWHIRPLKDALFCFAGLWEPGSGLAGDPDRFVILTTRPNAVVARIHDRMPVIVSPRDFEAWLGPGDPPLRWDEPWPADLIEAHPVGPRVNDPANDDPSLQLPSDPGTLFL